MALDEITTPLDELERHTAERAIAKASNTAEERRRNRRVLAKMLSGRVVQAIDAMAYQGMTFDEAAEHARMKPANLRQSLASDVAKKYLAEVENGARRGYRLQALHRTNELARTAASEHVKLGANKALLVNPELKAPATPPINVNVGLAIGAGEIIRPGIVIDCSQKDPRRELAAKMQADEATRVRTLRAVDLEDVDREPGPRFIRRDDR